MYDIVHVAREILKFNWQCNDALFVLVKLESNLKSYLLQTYLIKFIYSIVMYRVTSFNFSFVNWSSFLLNNSIQRDFQDFQDHKVQFKI